MKLRIYLVFFYMTLSVIIYGQSGTLDNTFQSSTGADAQVLSVAIQEDGKVLIGGWFNSYNGTSISRIARLNIDGSLDTSFDHGGVGGSIESIVIQPDGKVLIGGQFTSYDGIGRNYIARINADGSLDTGFDPGSGADNVVKSIALQSDGKILIGGQFNSFNGISRNAIARLNTDGSLDTSFVPGSGPDGAGYINSIILQSDNKVLIGGIFSSFNGINTKGAARLNTDGSVDTSFTGNVVNGIYSMVMQPNGKLIVGSSNVIRLNIDGSVDTSFDNGADSYVRAILILSDGKVLIGGSFTNYNGTSRNHIARLNADGSVDTSFDPGNGVNDDIYAISLQADDKVIVGGYFTEYNGINIGYIARVYSIALSTEPTSQPTSLSFANVAPTSFDVSFVSASDNPDNYIVIRREGAAPTSDPIDGTEYAEDDALGDGIVAYVGNLTNFSESNLNANTNYYYKAYSLNGSGTSSNYLTISPLEDNVTTLANEPTAQSTNLTFTNIAPTTFDVSFTAASDNPDNYIVIRREGAAPTSDPIDGAAYAVDDAFGDGTVAYVGNLTNFSESNLNANTKYYFKVFSLNGSGASSNYLTTSPLTGNVTTLAIEPTSQPTNLSFTSIGTTGFDISYTTASDNPSGYLAIRSEGESPDTAPEDGTNYTVGGSLGNSTIAFVGSNNAFTETSLTANSTYYYNIYSYNDGNDKAINYLNTSPLSGNQTTSSSSVPTPTISSFTPANGIIGTTVTINGTNYSSTPSENTVKFNGTVATVSASSTTSITTSVPDGATTGPITVQVGGQSVTSDTNFQVDEQSTSVSITDESFISLAEPGGTNSVSVTVNDASLISEALFWQRGISDKSSEYTSSSVSAANDVYTVSLQDADLTDPIGLQYYFEFKDADAGVVTSSTGELYLTYTDGATAIPGLSFGDQVSNYQIIAIPLELDNEGVTDIFDELGQYDKKYWRLFDYSGGDNREYPAFNNISTGKGYWLIIRNNTAIKLGAGTTVSADQSNPYTINLSTGWNLIGNPYNFSISWTDVLNFNGNPSGVSNLKTFASGTLSDNDVLSKFRGGFVYADASTSIDIPVTRNTSLGGRKGNFSDKKYLSEKNWEVPINIQQGQIINKIGGFGMHEQAKEKGKDPYDEMAFPFPTFMKAVEVKFEHNELGAYFNKDIVAPHENYQWTMMLDYSDNNEPVTLSWDNSNFGDGAVNLYLIDAKNNKAINMHDHNSYVIKNKTSQLKVVYGQKDYVEDVLDNSLRVVGKPYPQPATQQVYIPIRITRDFTNRPVEFKVYDSMGTLILVQNKKMSYGEHQLMWDSGRCQGLYIVKIRMGNALYSKKVIIGK